MHGENVLGCSPLPRSPPDSNPGLSQGNPLKVGWIDIPITLSMFMMNPGMLTGYQNIGLISQFSASHS